jgi:hypothetical protein
MLMPIIVVRAISSIANTSLPHMMAVGRGLSVINISKPYEKG